MHRLFIPSKNIRGDKANIDDGGQLHHLYRVLRARAGKMLAIFDEKGAEYKARIDSISPGAARLAIVGTMAGNVRRAGLTVAVAIPKKAKFDDIVDKLTQLGVARVIPMTTKRTIVKIDAARAGQKYGRWEKIARGAAEQSQRNDLPAIDPVSSIEKVVEESAGYALRLIPALSEKSRLLKDALGQTAGGNGRSPLQHLPCRPQNIIVLIGPEGDFTDGEIELCVRAGFLPVTLGNQVLRVDTAAIAAASYIMLNSA